MNEEMHASIVPSALAARSGVEPDYTAMLQEAGILQPGTIWSEIFWAPGYFVGWHGEVASCHGRKAKILSPIKMGTYDGYQIKCADGVLRKVYRHRLVAETVHGPAPVGYVCRHLDGDKTNNDWTNLMWGTHAENMEDSVRHGATCRGARNGNAKLTERDVAEMRAMRASGETYRAIADAYGVSTMTALRAVNGVSWNV